MGELHNEIHYGHQFLTAIAQAVGLGDEEGTSRLGETLTPVIDLWRQPEWNFLRADRLEGGLFDVTGAVGEVSQALLYNPVDSNVLGVIEQFRVTPLTGTGTYNLRLYRGASPAGFVANNSGPLDTRDPQLIAASGSRLQVLQDSVVAAIGGLPFDVLRLVLDTMYREPSPMIVLGPGTGFAIDDAGTARRMHGGFRWRERTMLPRENRAP